MSQTQTRSSLRINSTPFRPTLLSIPPSPFSPCTPLTPKTIPRPQHQPNSTNSTIKYTAPTTETPSTPLSWTWQCHHCHGSYPLSATRRCLEDGHTYCSGTTAVNSWRKSVSSRRTERHHACASEFDYTGWKNWGRWRRSGSAIKQYGMVRSRPVLVDSVPSERSKDCWNACDYPSECRWGRRFGMHTPLETGFSRSAPIHLDTTPAQYPEEGILKAESVKTTWEKNGKEGNGKTDLWALLANARKRKSCVSPSSPLGTVPEKMETRITDRDSDNVMQSIDPGLLSTTPLPKVGSNREMGAVLMLKVPIPVLTKGKEDVGMDDLDVILDGFAPLERAQSKSVGVQLELGRFEVGD